MRTLRTRVALLAALVVVLGVAGTASANSISATWLSTTASGASGVGTADLTIGPGNTGATAVLRVFVNASATGVNAVGVVYNYATSILASATEVRCPGGGAPGNPFGPGICGSNFAGLLTTNSNAVNTPGQIGGIQTDGVPPGGQNTQFTFADITFTIASGTGTTGELAFRPGIDGIVTTASAFVIPPVTQASITVIPEPGTIALMALGLGALAFVGRRR